MLSISKNYLSSTLRKFAAGICIAESLRPESFSQCSCMITFKDPSFDEMLRALTVMTRVCLIEWLRCGGAYKVVRCPPDKAT